MRFIQQLPGQFTDKNSKTSAKAAFMKNLKRGSKGSNAQSNPEERYKEIFQQKVEEMRNEALKGSKYTFNLPGTDPAKCKELSKGAQEIINKIAEKKAQQAEKKAKKADIISVRAKYFTGQQGGRIDNRGRIFDAAGQIILEVDRKSGKIKHAANGRTVGNYNPDSSYSEHRICELISKYSTTNRNGWYAGTAGAAGTDTGGTIWGKNSNSCGNGSIWGEAPASGGTIWGNSESNNTSWW